MFDVLQRLRRESATVSISSGPARSIRRAKGRRISRRSIIWPALKEADIIEENAIRAASAGPGADVDVLNEKARALTIHAALIS